MANGLVAALVALPSTVYQYYLYCTEPVFQMRADTPTLTPAVISYLEGYGLVLLLAIGGVIALARAARRRGEALGERLLPIVWGGVGFAVPYLPFSFQRKLVMGLHLPLAFLAAVGAVALTRWVAHRVSGVGQAVSVPAAGSSDSQRPGTKVNSRPHSRLAAAIVPGLLLLTLPTNWCFIYWNIWEATTPSNDPNRPVRFISNADMEALRWARGHLAPDGVVLCSVANGLLFPALAGRQVYVGHGSECPRWEERMLDAAAFYQTVNASPAERRRFLADRKVRYVYQSSTERAWGAANFDRDTCLRPIYRGAGTVIYELGRNG